MGRKKGGIGMGGKNGGTSMVRIGMSIETREGREWVRKDGHGRGRMGMGERNEWEIKEVGRKGGEERRHH